MSSIVEKGGWKVPSRVSFSHIEGANSMMSQLLIQTANKADSGTYTCKAAYTSEKHREELTSLQAKVNIHVIEGSF